MTRRLGERIAALADPEDLARGQEGNVAAGAGYAALRQQLSEANDKVVRLVTAVASGVAMEDVTAAPSSATS